MLRLLLAASSQLPCPLSPCTQREVVVSRPSFVAAGSGGLADCLTESFISLEEQMKEPHNKPELYSLSRGGGWAGRPLSDGKESRLRLVVAARLSV